MTKKILVIFDFCDTLIDGQSISLFLEFLLQKQSILKRIYLKLRNKFNPYVSSNTLKYKNYLLRPYRGLTKQQLDSLSRDFYTNILKKRFYPKIIKLLQSHINKGQGVYVVSAAFNLYLEYFKNEFKVKDIFSTELRFKENIFTGEIKKECIGKEKLEILKENVDLKIYDLVNSYVYSDSKSDLPLYSLVGNKIVIYKDQDLSWINKSFKVIKL